jgi:hypothetical protein
MKNKSFIILVAATAFSVGIISCGFFGAQWDAEETLTGFSNSWASRYVGSPINDFNLFRNDILDSIRNNGSGLKDTISVDYRFMESDHGDSVNITTSIKLIDDQIVVISDGYRFSDDLRAHIFTVDPGIIDCSGKVHIDFYRTGETNPWAWGEVTFKVREDDIGYYYGNFEDTEVGWY